MGGDEQAAVEMERGGGNLIEPITESIVLGLLFDPAVSDWK